MFGSVITPQIPVITAKAPFDAFSLPVDFSDVLPVGDTIATVVSVTPSSSDLIVAAIGIVPGSGGAARAVALALSGGTAASFYTVTINIVTTFGNRYSRSFRISAQER
jgi:hypothetical protein